MALERLEITEATTDHVGRAHVERDIAGQATGRLLGSVNNYCSDQPFTDDLYRRLPCCGSTPSSRAPSERRRCLHSSEFRDSH
jgi:hypothetical protein